MPSRIKVVEVVGTQATHKITVHDEMLTQAEFTRRGNLTRYEPDYSGFEYFKTSGRASRWLKILLKKPGWPERSDWEIWQNIDGKSYSAYFVG